MATTWVLIVLAFGPLESTERMEIKGIPTAEQCYSMGEDATAGRRAIYRCLAR